MSVPNLFSIYIADLRPQSQLNDMVKFADDATLLVPESSDIDITEEFEAVKQWANDNRMIINLAKTKEIVFHRPKPSRFIPPPCLNNVERVFCAKLLGVYIDSTFRFSEHVDFILRQCTQRMYALRTLRNRGLNLASLEVIFNALVLSRIIYAISSWGAYITAHDCSRFDKLMSRAVKFKYCSKVNKFEALLERADSILFRKANNSEHCLYNILPVVRNYAITLRDRGHPFTLPTCKFELHKKSFIVRSLFKNM